MCQQEYNLASVLMVFLTNSDPIDRQNLRQVKPSVDPFDEPIIIAT